MKKENFYYFNTFSATAFKSKNRTRPIWKNLKQQAGKIPLNKKSELKIKLEDLVKLKNKEKELYDLSLKCINTCCRFTKRSPIFKRTLGKENNFFFLS